MLVIPAIDLKSGAVVHARLGSRAGYRPLRSRLTAGNDPVEVIGALRRLHPFPVVYVADLDRIEGAGDNDSALQAIRKAFPKLELWIDAGIGTLAALEAWHKTGLGRAVVGSETLKSYSEWRRMLRSGDVILSLDFRGRRFIGPPPLASNAAVWPARVLVMALSRVGGGQGPDLARLTDVLRRAGRRRIFSAGGVRNVSDVKRIAARGAAGVLAASALHQGRLGPRAIAQGRK